MSNQLFTPRFFVMCGFSFTVFLSAFMLIPTAPFHIRDLGGTAVAAGSFLGLLTYFSAFSAPVTGTLADHFGRRKQLIVCSLLIAGFSTVYAVAPTVSLLLMLVPIHGLVWSGLLSASAAYITSILPPGRRSEGIGYWGLASVIALVVAPPTGLWMYRYGWFWLCMFAAALNLVMALIAVRLEDTHSPHRVTRLASHQWIEWRVLLLSAPLFLYSYGYGTVTTFSSVYAEALGVRPHSIFLTTLAIVILITRPFFGRLGDRMGYQRVFLPCLILMAIGLGLLALSSSRAGLVTAAIVFGAGFGTAYPVFAAHVTHSSPAHRRGAAFGAILAAFDTGIGTGSTASGWLIEHYGFTAAFTVAAALAALALPAALVTGRERREAGSAEIAPSPH
ncbi:MAG TPA: MFS transporter [Vicinamibacterales bacterium]|nr:MFS transporter [Vicinamibacterales bacterium]